MNPELSTAPRSGRSETKGSESDHPESVNHCLCQRQHHCPCQRQRHCPWQRQHHCPCQRPETSCQCLTTSPPTDHATGHRISICQSWLHDQDGGKGPPFLLQPLTGQPYTGLSSTDGCEVGHPLGGQERIRAPFPLQTVTEKESGMEKESKLESLGLTSSLGLTPLRAQERFVARENAAPMSELPLDLRFPTKSD